MKERPILFSGAMVRAILSGRKTQTRRVVKWVKSLPDGRGWDCVINRRTGGAVPLIDGKLQWSPFGGAPYEPYPHVEQCCPYGEAGDRLWVKETFSTDAVCMYPCPRAWYRATDFNDRSDLNDVHVCPKHARGRWADCLACWEEREGRKFRWRPSIFMRRELSRISLEIVSVRVERLQEISEGDAVAEGIEPVQMPTGEVMYEDYLEGGALVARAVSSYATLWDRINGAGAFSTNPWVWVVEFKKL